MPNIQLKRSLTTGSLPTTASLLEGEIAMNVPDGRIFLRKSGSGSDTIESVITTGARNSGSVQLTGSMSVSGSGDVLTAQGDNIFFTGNLMEFSGDAFEMTGSLAVVGNTVMTGSLAVTQGITGTLIGTSSWAVSSSQAVSSSFATTASFTNVAGLGGFVQGGNSFGATALLGTNDNQSLSIETSGSVRMFVSSSGNVGVGTLTPVGRLSVVDTTLSSGSSNAGSLLDLQQTWNTAGSPTAIKLNITNTTSGGASNLIDLQLDSVSRLSFSKFSVLRLSNNHTFSPFTSTSGDENAIGFLGTSIKVTGTSNGLSISAGLSTTSGTAVHNLATLFGNINQTGGANGITRGLYVNPTLTSAFDFRAIETTRGRNILADTYAASGSLSGSLLDLSQTWNTAGTVSGIKYNVTNTLSGAGSKLLDLQVGGVSRVSVDPAGGITGSRAFLSGSTNTASGSILTVVGSGSTQPVFTVQGSQGELFSVTDSLSGSLFSVNDISGLPILEVFSDNTTLIGNYLDPMLITTAKTVLTNSGSFTVYSIPTSSFDAAFFEYSVRSGSNARAGQIMAIQSGSAVNYTETTTTSFGSTTGISLGVFITGSNLVLTGSASTSAWTIKTIVRAL